MFRIFEPIHKLMMRTCAQEQHNVVFVNGGVNDGVEQVDNDNGDDDSDDNVDEDEDYDVDGDDNNVDGGY